MAVMPLPPLPTYFPELQSDLMVAIFFKKLARELQYFTQPARNNSKISFKLHLEKGISYIKIKKSWMAQIL